MSTPSNTAWVRPAKEQIQRYIPAGLFVSVLVAFLSTWHWKVTGHLSGSAIAVFAAFSSSSLIYGGFVLRFSPLPAELAVRLTQQFLFGFLLFNTCLFVLTLAFTWGVAICFLILVAVALATLFIRGGQTKTNSETTNQVPDLLCLLISGVGATLWCTDALSPIMIDGQHTVFKIWQDSFAHIRMISLFAQAHGLNEVSDLRMAGAPPVLYHYASYFMPAAIERLTGASAFEVFVGFQLPFGVLLTGLAAFALASSLWGPWPGLAATCAIILLPDAYLQGFANRYLSYDFLQQVNLAGLYGVSCAAAAWICILSGCKSGKIGLIVIGYGLILLTAAYKSQLFVANAFLAMIYPFLFFTGLRASRRWFAAAALLILFGGTVWLSQKVKEVPTLRPDLSFASAAQYTSWVLSFYDPGFWKSFFSWLILPNRSKSHCRIIRGRNDPTLQLWHVDWCFRRHIYPPLEKNRAREFCFFRCS